MKTNLIQAPGACKIEVHASDRVSFVEYHITASVQGSLRASQAADDVFTQIAAILIGRKIQPMQEKVYGRRSASAEILAHRDAVYRERGLDRTMPVTWIEGTPLGTCDFVGVQLWGIAPRNGEVCITTVENPHTGRGRLWKGNGYELLHLASVRGTAPDGNLPSGHVAQATNMFTNIGQAVQTFGMKYTNVIRTWIYVDRLLEWYGDLNRVRTGIYRAAGFGAAGGHPFPASTGIMGRSDNEECIVDVLALKAEAPEAAAAVPVLRSPRQDSSFNYGSAFSRGMAIEIEGRRTVHISGTASINTAGASTYLGDAEHQSLETLLSISAILEEQGGSLQNITSATLFCKNKEAWEAWERVTKLLEVPKLPKICVIADVCRDDLLVEMEAVAVI
jgi:enamine deaminase RidA (YjgF/YER057c/UK114 family)